MQVQKMNKLTGLLSRVVQGDARSVTVKKNIIFSFLLKGVGILTSLLLVPLTIGYVSPELYGVWLTLSSILTWVGFMDLGFSQGLKNKLTEAIAKNEWERGRSLVSTTYFMMLIITIPLCIVLEFVVPYVNWAGLLNVNPIYSDEIITAMYACVAFTSLQMVVRVVVSVIAAFQKVALSESFGVIGNVISLLLIAILTRVCPPSLFVLACTLGAMPILVTFVASIILFCGKYKSVAPSFKFVRVDYIKDLFGLGYKFFIINIQVLVLFQSTNILISYVSSPLEVTNYNIAYKLLNCGMMLYTMITAPLWPAYTDAYTKQDYVWMSNVRNRMKKILLFSILGCFIIVALSQPIYHLWIGEKVTVPFTMTLLVAIYVSAYCWMNLNGTLLVGMGKIQLETRIVLVGMFLHIPVSLLLGKYIGAYGVLVSLIVINLFYAIVMHIQVNRLLNKTAKGIWNK